MKDKCTKTIVFYDDDSNKYRVERAHNGMWLVMRYNVGGNRKLFKQIQPHKHRSVAIQRLNDWAKNNNWNGEQNDGC